MKILLVILFCSLLLSCGEKTETVIGVSGTDGTSCYAQEKSGEKYVVCGGSEFKIEDGVDGQNGVDGSFDGYLELVQICPEITGNNIEILLYLDGQYMAFLTNPNYKKQRLVIMEEGTLFETTDGRKIKFTIDNGNILYVTNGCVNFEPVQ